MPWRLHRRPELTPAAHEIAMISLAEIKSASCWGRAQPGFERCACRIAANPWFVANEIVATKRRPTVCAIVAAHLTAGSLGNGGSV
jgi:hypothetical protein